MRYLNKIIFIESAKIKYAEVAVDGNVHFIGTQGVGKSTALRAILFFYNADKIKLGIEKSKYSFDEYYLPLGNSYIVYEVSRETGPFCIFVFKSQGRACFRFIDGEYNRENYLDSDLRPMEWDGIRTCLTRSGNRYSRKIDRYEEYRDILYGNNRGLDADLRKYAIIESKQYQNIPRTIQNVFLNSKLDAEFIKQTIIMSLNEEDVKISLDNYTLHLRDFDTQLADINKWTEKNKSGDIPVRLQAEKIARLQAEIRFLDHEKQGAATVLFQTYKAEQLNLPEIEKSLSSEKTKHDAFSKRLSELDAKFQIRKEEIQRVINNLDSDLKRAKQKSQEYEIINIAGIIQRVSKKTDIEREQKKLLEEKDLLTSKFNDINARYEALLLQQQTGLDQLKNDFHARRNSLQIKLINYKNEVGEEYRTLFEEIRQQFSQSLELARDGITQKNENIFELKLKKQEAELKRFFEKETDAVKDEIATLKLKIADNNSAISDCRKQAEHWQKQWELDTEKNQTAFVRRKEKIQDETEQISRNIAAIDAKLERNKDSLYGWLCENVSEWENTIGKVIDEDEVLFHRSLSPQLTPFASDTLFGVKIDLDEIAKTVKTVADYQEEKLKLQKRIKVNDTNFNDLNEQEKDEADKLKRKYQPKIKEAKETGYESEYALAKAKEELLKNEVRLNEIIDKAADEKTRLIATIDEGIVVAQQELVDEQLNHTFIEGNLRKQLEIRGKEQNKKINKEEDRIKDETASLDLELKIKTQDTTQRIAELKQQQTGDLHKEGADTNRLEIIENVLLTIRKELDFIEANRDHVADYNKDRRELFDHVDRFRAERKLKEALLETEKGKHLFQREKLKKDIETLQNTLNDLNGRIAKINEGFRAFDEFKTTENFLQIVALTTHPPSILTERKEIKVLIDNVNYKIYVLKDKFTELQTAVNKFLGNFSINNIFGFKTNLFDQEEFMSFAEMLYAFLEEDKITEYEQRVNERFATLIRQIGKETTELVSKEGEIQKVITDINRDFEERNFAGVIKSIKLQLSASQNKIVALLLAIKRFNDQNALNLGAANLFSTGDRETQNKRAIDLLKEFAKEIGNRKETEISLSDSFELQFRIVENDNDSHWVEKLANVGSEGTDVLVKAMINIMLLNVFKENASRKFKDFRLHCMMDEIGKLHPNNVKGILKFANDRNILLINSSPTSYNATDYRYTYLLSKDLKNITTVKRLIKKGE